VVNELAKLAGFEPAPIAQASAWAGVADRVFFETFPSESRKTALERIDQLGTWSEVAPKWLRNQPRNVELALAIETIGEAFPVAGGCRQCRCFFGFRNELLIARQFRLASRNFEACLSNLRQSTSSYEKRRNINIDA